MHIPIICLVIIILSFTVIVDMAGSFLIGLFVSLVSCTIVVLLDAILSELKFIRYELERKK